MYINFVFAYIGEIPGDPPSLGLNFRFMSELSCSSIHGNSLFALQNVSKALTALHDLKELQFSAADLEKVPDLVYTVRKVGVVIENWFL